MGLLSDVFGSRPKLPKFRPVNIDDEVRKTIAANRANLTDATALARDTASADTAIALQSLEQFAPGSRDVISGLVNNIQSGLRGELPADVQRQISDQANATAFAGGFGGSAAGRNLGLRDFGLTSLQRSNQAIAQAGQALALFGQLAPRSFGVGSSFLTPGQRINALQAERNAQFQAESQRALANAGPNPVAAGLAGPLGKLGGAFIGAAFPSVFGGGDSTFGNRFGNNLGLNPSRN